MKCPFCRSADTEVYNTRTTKFGSQLWRRRRCKACREAFTTYEAPDLRWLRVTTQNGSERPYSRVKLYAAIAGAFAPDDPPVDMTDGITDTIETKLLDLKTRTITTTQIATITLGTLKHFSTPAFLRYLASHAELSSKSDLKRQLKNL